MVIRWEGSERLTETCMCWSVGPGRKERSCQMVPPRARFRICMPRQMPSTGRPASSTWRMKLRWNQSVFQSVLPWPVSGSSPKEKRGDVIAAAEEEATAQPGEGRVTGLLAAGDHKRDPAGGFHRPDIGVCHKLASPVQPAGDNADH